VTRLDIFSYNLKVNSKLKSTIESRHFLFRFQLLAKMAGRTNSKILRRKSQVLVQLANPVKEEWLSLQISWRAYKVEVIILISKMSRSESKGKSFRSCFEEKDDLDPHSEVDRSMLESLKTTQKERRLILSFYWKCFGRQFRVCF